MTELDRWFDGDYSEMFFGMGHQDKDAFALWVVDTQVEEFGYILAEAATGIDPSSVRHTWAVWEDEHSPPERFEFCTVETPGAWPITVLSL